MLLFIRLYLNVVIRSFEFLIFDKVDIVDKGKELNVVLFKMISLCFGCERYLKWKRRLLKEETELIFLYFWICFCLELIYEYNGKANEVNAHIKSCDLKF